MIRAALGRFFQHCIERARQRQMQVEVRQIDFARMSDAEISAWVHGCRGNPAVRAAQAALGDARRALGRAS